MSTLKTTNIAHPSSASNNVVLDNSGNVGIGTNAPSALLDLGTATPIVRFSDTDTTGYHEIRSSNTNFIINADPSNADANSAISFNVDGSERARVDSSGNLLVGTNASVTGSAFSVEIVGDDTASPFLTLARNDTNIALNNVLGRIRFYGNDANGTYEECARIDAAADGTHGDGDKPTRLSFWTTADNQGSPTERMRITNSGQTSINAEADAPLVLDRLTNDGTVVSIRQNSVQEGAISVSGTTVTYGGGHLARWSQLPNNEDPSDILKGTVMTNLDEMCEWGDEDNEQLNKTKISDVEGDPNVAGVFVSTSFNEEGPSDFFVAMTGDMVIRIGAGVTVERGDLLMSAGDGTAKPQDDDIIRSKTIAKVTSTNVSCTYDDGSYCVPCVLMAC